MLTLRISAAVHALLRDTVGTKEPETGAVIAAPNADGTYVTKVWFDAPAGAGKEFYSPSGEPIAQVVRQWNKEGHGFAGIVHSHRRSPVLSPLDLCAAAAILRENGLSHLFLGLFCGGELSFFQVCPCDDGLGCTAEPVRYAVVPDPQIPGDGAGRSLFFVDSGRKP